MFTFPPLDYSVMSWIRVRVLIFFVSFDRLTLNTNHFPLVWNDSAGLAFFYIWSHSEMFKMSLHDVVVKSLPSIVKIILCHTFSPFWLHKCKDKFGMENQE